MSRYIDADKIDWRLIIQTNATIAEENIIYHARKLVEFQPTADVVEVVRCKDCKWQDKGENECESWNLCRHNVIEHFAIYDEHFCSWGERREE